MEQARSNIPQNTAFVLSFLGQPDLAGHAEGVRMAKALRDHYDPISQTSTVPAYAGTSATYCGTGTGYLPFPDDDDKRDDY